MNFVRFLRTSKMAASLTKTNENKEIKVQKNIKKISALFLGLSSITEAQAKNSFLIKKHVLSGNEINNRFQQCKGVPLISVKYYYEV